MPSKVFRIDRRYLEENWKKAPYCHSLQVRIGLLGCKKKQKEKSYELQKR
jgi:hypothetical protein